MKRLLFVDDEPQVLDALRNLLRRHRKKWEMVFALGGEEALDQLAQQRFDVVVSDMRMPRIDGAQLLARVRAEHPHMVRIILSGYSEQESALNVMPLAHQFLTKPCDPARLEAVIERACALQLLIHDARLREIVGRIGKLPSLPSLYSELSAVLANPKAEVGDAARLIGRDLAMSAKLLQLVNSSFFGLGRRIASVEAAVGYLGLGMVRNLVLALSAFDASARPRPGFSIEMLQAHCQLAAGIARKLLTDRKQAEEAFLAAMLHDIGKLILATALTVEEEAALDGVTHAEVGAYLLGLWGLPYAVVEAVAHHHHPERAQPVALDVVAAVHLADALAHELEGREALIDPAWLAAIGVTEEKLEGWRALATDCAQGG